MDLNEFIFRDDTAEALGADVEIDDACIATEETHGSEKAGFAAIGSAVLGLSNFLGHVTKGH